MRSFGSLSSRVSYGIDENSHASSEFLKRGALLSAKGCWKNLRAVNELSAHKHASSQQGAPQHGRS
eukprot:4229626-Amphidinium_carterae.1